MQICRDEEKKYEHKHFFASSSRTPRVEPDPIPASPLIPANVNPDSLSLAVVTIVPTSTNERPDPSTPSNERNDTTFDESTNQPRMPILEFHPSQIIADPGLRIPIEDYAPEIRSDVRRAYLLKGRNKAIGHNFEKTKDGKIWRSFQPA